MKSEPFGMNFEFFGNNTFAIGEVMGNQFIAKTSPVFENAMKKTPDKKEMFFLFAYKLFYICFENEELHETRRR